MKTHSMLKTALLAWLATGVMAGEICLAQWGGSGSRDRGGQSGVQNQPRGGQHFAPSRSAVNSWPKANSSGGLFAPSKPAGNTWLKPNPSGGLFVPNKPIFKPRPPANKGGTSGDPEIRDEVDLVNAQGPLKPPTTNTPTPPKPPATPTWPSQPGPPRPNWPGIVDGMIGVLGSLPSQPANTGHQPQPPVQHSVEYPPPNSFVPVPPETPQQPIPSVPLPANELPKEEPQLLKNKAVKLARATPEQISATEAVLKEQATEEINDIKADLEKVDPALANDPGVQAELDNMKEKINRGEALTDADHAALQNAVSAAAAANGINLGNPADPKVAQIVAAVDGNMEQAIKISDTIQLNQSQQAGGQGGLLDQLVRIIFNPGMGPEETAELPGGDVVTGNPDVLDGLPPGAVDAGQVAIVEGTAADALGVPLAAGPPVPESSVDASSWVTSGTLLMNAQANRAPVSYLLNGSPFTMQPGDRQQLPSPGPWTIRFSRGPHHGEAEYGLSEGTYAFSPSDSGWDLYQTTFELTIDNTRNRSDFSYLLDHQPQTIKGKQSQTHTGRYPLLLNFDRGGGNQPAQKHVAERQSKLVVAVNPDDKLWDLFPADRLRDARPKLAKPKSDNKRTAASWPKATSRAPDQLGM